MTSSIGNINAFSYSSNMINGAGGKLYVPVNKLSLVYSNFDHVQGVAAKSGQNGVSISKIQILNALIDRLSQIKNQPKESITDISDQQAEVLIKNYQEQIQQAVKQSAYAYTSLRAETGVLFSLDA
ncbi:MAG: hypothetical protein K5866_08145 [Treponema sp.]|nr:hypothetical protein [Treponema sp.]